MVKLLVEGGSHRMKVLSYDLTNYQVYGLLAIERNERDTYRSK